MKRIIFPLISIVGVALAGCDDAKFTPYDVKRAQEFVLSALPPLPPDPSNIVADNPEAAAFGEMLFFDVGLSVNDGIACASCHRPDRDFQDSLPVGFGTEQVTRRTMPLRGAQWGQWFYWDGRKDSQWSQALEPFETPAEHGMTRDLVAREVLDRYRDDYEAIFGSAPDTSNWPERVSPLVPGPELEKWHETPVEIQDKINRVFSNIGKALAAYQRTLMPEENRFDRYVSALLDGKEIYEADRLTSREIRGFQLFAGKAQCDNCHSGPLFTDHFFHNTGVPIADRTRPDRGRAPAVLFLKTDMFLCTGRYSDTGPEDCRELRFMSEDPTVFEGAFKTPGLRGVSARAPYMHAGQIDNLEAVVRHYLERPDPFRNLPEPDGSVEDHGPHTDAPKIELSEDEIRDLVAFLELL